MEKIAVTYTNIESLTYIWTICDTDNTLQITKSKVTSSRYQPNERTYLLAIHGAVKYIADSFRMYIAAPNKNQIIICAQISKKERKLEEM
jgi:hypothetical protein